MIYLIEFEPDYYWDKSFDFVISVFILIIEILFCLFLQWLKNNLEILGYTSVSQPHRMIIFI